MTGCAAGLAASVSAFAGVACSAALRRPTRGGHASTGADGTAAAAATLTGATGSASARAAGATAGASDRARAVVVVVPVRAREIRARVQRAADPERRSGEREHGAQTKAHEHQ